MNTMPTQTKLPGKCSNWNQKNINQSTRVGKNPQVMEGHQQFPRKRARERNTRSRLSAIYEPPVYKPADNDFKSVEINRQVMRGQPHEPFPRERQRQREKYKKPFERHLWAASLYTGNKTRNIPTANWEPPKTRRDTVSADSAAWVAS